jgi:hypothetical protein
MTWLLILAQKDSDLISNPGQRYSTLLNATMYYCYDAKAMETTPEFGVFRLTGSSPSSHTHSGEWDKKQVGKKTKQNLH